MIKTITVLIIAIVLGGCASKPGGVFGVSTYGTYRFTADRERMEVNAQTIKGGPHVEYETRADGTTVLHVRPSNAEVIKSVVDAITPILGQ
jgi:hypothetical protein